MIYPRVFEPAYLAELVGSLEPGWYAIRVRPGNPGPAEEPFREAIMAAVLLWRYIDRAPQGGIRGLLEAEACLLGPYATRRDARRARHADADVPRRLLMKKGGGLRWQQ